MKKQVNIAKYFSKHLFWDTDASRLSVKRDKAIVIPRALYATTKNSFEEDIQKLEKLYSSTEIISVLRTTKELISNETCNLVAKRYHTKPFHRFSL